MKALYKTFLLTLGLAFLTACGKEDAVKDYGFGRVYIPQATVTGIDNSYPIPLGPFYRNSVYCCSYNQDNGMLDIAVGVIRAGYFAHQEAYSVSLGATEALTAAKLKALEEAGTPAAALPVDVCSIPGSLSVPEGESGATCKVRVDLKALAARRASFYADGQYRKLVLGLEISGLNGPDSYSLADQNTSVVILLDLGSEHWDSVSADKPESQVRSLFPFD